MSGIGLTDAIVLPSDDLAVGMTCKIGEPPAEGSSASAAEKEDAGNGQKDTAGNEQKEAAGNEQKETGESSTPAV